MGSKLSLTELQRAADQCVKCAVCLPHCPTYALSREEAESPRGRITWLQGMVHGRLEPTEDIHRHLDSCLNCGRCEQVCPANVPYTRLLDGTRLHLSQQAHLSSPPVTSLSRRLADWLQRPRLLQFLGTLGQFARVLRLHTLMGNTRAARMVRSLPHRSRIPARVPVVAHTSAIFFAGCLSNSIEKDAAAAARQLAAAYGIELQTADQSLCCGALYQHQADEASMLKLAGAALQAWTSATGNDDGRPIAALQTGCGRGLKDGLRFLDHPQAESTATRVVDVFELLLTVGTPPAFVTSTDSVAFYAPCSVDGQLATRYRTVLERHAGVDLAVVNAGLGCCGAAGDHMLTQPSRADQLVAPLVEDILDRGYTHVLTPNAGCAWHLRSGLRARGSATLVEHPATWMVRHLATQTSKEND